MSTPDQTPNEERFDDQLRRQLDFKPAPIPGGWERLRANLPPRPAPSPWVRARPFGAGVVVGALLWWGGGHLSPTPAQPAPHRAETAQQPAGPARDLTPPVRLAVEPAPVTAEPVELAAATVRPTAATTRLTVAFTRRPAEPVPPVAALNPPLEASAPPVRFAVAGLAASVEIRDSVIQQEARAYLAPLTQAADSGRNARLRVLVAEQTQALAVLLARLDSVKQALPEAPPALAISPVDSAALALGMAPTTSSDWRTLPAPRSPWAVVGLLETTPNWSVLPSPTLGVDQERTEASLAQSLQVQRQVGNRWRVRAGAGQVTLHTQARYVSERIKETIKRDTFWSFDTLLHVGTRVVMVIGPTPDDTTYQFFTTYDTVVTQTIDARAVTVTQRDKLQQLLRPEYRFWTLPFSAQYLLVNHNRWNLGLSVGGQVTFFRGGAVSVWTGEEYRLQRVSARQGPYRPVSLSVSAGLEAQYRLTPRLSALVAPTLRWWALPPSQGRNASRSLLPAAQVGLTYGF